MPTILQELDAAFRKAVQAAFGFDADPLLAVSQNEKFGDYQSNAAMGLARQVSERTGQKTNPRSVAEQLKSKLELGDLASEVSIAGPGFVNVRLSPQWLGKRLAALRSDPRLGIPKTEDPSTVVVDYSGVNVAKQMHVGHLRSTNIGDAIARILEFQGQTVIRQNHIGDWGTQFGMLIAFLKWTGLGADARIEDLDVFYKKAREKFDADPAFQEEARQTVVRLQAGGVEELALWKQIVDASRAHFQPLYERLGVRLTRADERGESTYNALLPSVVAELLEKGVAVKSEGAIVVFTEGDEAPLIIQKQDGGFGYATTDLAALRFRVSELRANRILYFVGSPQAQHFRQVFAAARRAGWTQDLELEHASFGSVLGEDRKMFKARKGESVKLAELLDEAEERALKLVTEKSAEIPDAQRRSIARAVGIGAIKYADLSKDRNSDYIFSFDAMLAMDGNTAPYLQYAHARIKSIFRKAGGVPATSTPVQLETPHELALAKHVLRITEIVDLVARELKPHHLTTYLYDLATTFSGFYENCPVIQSEEPTRSS
ncbi:MAG: arginine--tRNA ligase, partial [Planctomycetota bacterium]|nr:arginine--tRNA ligase [Planctomycetota bacterium]